jgi:hypothetical protein
VDRVDGRVIVLPPRSPMIRFKLQVYGYVRLTCVPSTFAPLLTVNTYGRAMDKERPLVQPNVHVDVVESELLAEAGVRHEASSPAFTM